MQRRQFRWDGLEFFPGALGRSDLGFPFEFERAADIMAEGYRAYRALADSSGDI